MNSGDRLIEDAFRLSAWGPSPEHLSDLKDIEREIRSEPNSSGLITEFDAARADGARAYELANELELIFDREGQAVAQTWIIECASHLNPRIGRHLRICLGKRAKRRKNTDLRGKQTLHSSNVHAALIDGRHPNTLRLQEPGTDWDIFIDETGQIFDGSARELSVDHRLVGKLVALAVPAGIALEPLGYFHATDSTDEQVDEVVQRILDAPVGILGLSVQDDAARNSSWIGHVLHLIRWALLQLPVPVENDACHIKIHIEKRKKFEKDDYLRAMRKSLESEMAALDPARFSRLDLDMKFIGKDHPMNGYVDAVAFTWGSRSRASKDRLERSLLRGHCLVDADEVSLHHLYLALSERGPLAPVDWYELCTAAAHEPSNSFLSRSLESLGEELQWHQGLWQGYVDEVQFHLGSKRYVLSELHHAIAWLQRFSGRTEAIPSILQLQLSSSNLALANHQGSVNLEQIAACLGLAKQLHDEAPDLACEALLRMASALTNNFEFGKLDHVIDDWLIYPVAVPGLLNYGKLQSSKGQSLAFQGRAREALPYFDKAIASFERLSDPAHAKRESRQTNVYRLIALIDDALPRCSSKVNDQSVGLAIAEIIKHFNGHEPEEISRILAKCGQDERFAHHLWLRTLVCFPHHLVSARESYLLQMADWQDGLDHPWPLIQAYRGWLLNDAGDSEAARQQFERAISACEDASHGSTLRWMAEVLRILMLALRLKEGDGREGVARRNELGTLLPAAPHATLSDFAAAASNRPMSRVEILPHLEACLPFNFH